jgi:hypothetical protein
MACAAALLPQSLTAASCHQCVPDGGYWECLLGCVGGGSCGGLRGCEPQSNGCSFTGHCIIETFAASVSSAGTLEMTPATDGGSAASPTLRFAGGDGVEVWRLGCNALIVARAYPTAVALRHQLESRILTI